MFSFLRKLLGDSGSSPLTPFLNDGAIILDVRTEGEFDLGHVKGSLNLPLDEVRGQIAKLKKAGKPVIACCRSGRRSGIATVWLQQAGIRSINGGAWTTVRRAREAWLRNPALHQQPQ